MSGFAENINYVSGLDHKYGYSYALSKSNISTYAHTYSAMLTIGIYDRSIKMVVENSVSVTGVDALTFNDKILELITLANAINSHTSYTGTSTANAAFASVGIEVASNNTEYIIASMTLALNNGISNIYIINGEPVESIAILPYIATLDENILESIMYVSSNIEEIRNAEENVLLSTAAKDKADAFANSDRDVEVEQGKYSSKHYSIESEESMIDAKKIAIGTGEQTLSDGTIGYSSKHYSDVSALIKSEIEVIQDDIEDDLSDVIKVVMNPQDTQYTLSDGITTGYSAKHYHEKIIDLNATSLANIGATNADVLLTHADVVLTHEDVRLTGLDAEATGADVLTTESYMDLAEDYKNDALHLATNAKDSAVILSNGGGTVYSARHYAEYAEVYSDTASEMAADAIKTSINPIDEQYTLSDNTVDYSVKHYHAKTVIAKNAAEGSATAASTSAGLASTSAQAALLSQNAAAGSAADAATVLAQVSTIMDNFDDRYLGAKAEDPTLDNDGEALAIGAVYYNTTDKEVKFYDGTSWDRPEYSASQSAMAADTARENAVTAQGLSEAAKDIAVTKASEASGSASSAAVSATTASTKADEASNSAASAASSATIATEKAEAVSELFLGAKASDPSTDNEGGVLQVGAIYYSTSTNAMKVWNGTVWQVVVFDASRAVTSFNGRDGAVTLTASDVNTAIDVDIVETFDSHSELIVENTASILALAKSNATGSFGATGLSINMNSTEQVLTFDVHQQSTNADKFELTEDEIAIKATGNYTFISTVTFEDAGANGSVGTVTFRVRDAGNVYYTHTTTVEISGSDRDTVPFNSLMVVPGGVPITAYITVSCNIGGYRIVGFESVLASEKAVGELSGLASHTAVTPVGNIAATNVQAAIAELDSEKLAMTIANANHIGRADRYLAAQDVATMIYAAGKLSKVRYNNDTDVDYEVMTYNVNGGLSNVAHYIASALAGNTVLSYTDGKLVSAIYTGV